MNFVGEMNAFSRWIKANHLPPMAQFLWFKLMLYNNDCMWSEWVVVDNRTLMGLIGVNSEKTAIAARDKLIEFGLLEYRKGKKGSPNKYRFIPLYCKNYSISYSEYDSTNAVHPTVQSADIYIKQNETNTYGVDDAHEPEVTPENLFSRYFGNAPSPQEKELCGRWLEQLGGERVEQAFFTACMAGEKNLRYVRGVLNNYEERGIKDMGDVAADDMRRRR